MWRSRHGNSSPCREPAAGQLLEGLDIFPRGFFDDLGGQGGSGRGFVPIEGFEIIADELLVVARGASAGRAGFLRPEARGVGGEAFVYEENLVARQAELEFGIGHDDPARGGFRASVFIEVKGLRADFVGEFVAEDPEVLGGVVIAMLSGVLIHIGMPALAALDRDRLKSILDDIIVKGISL